MTSRPQIRKRKWNALSFSFRRTTFDPADDTSIASCLSSIALPALNALNLPQSAFASDSTEDAKCTFAYPFVRQDNDLTFASHYGDASVEFIGPRQKMVAVRSSSPCWIPRAGFAEDIRSDVARCVHSVSDEDATSGSLSLTLEKVFFAVNHDTYLAAEEAFLRHGAVFDGQYNLRPTASTQFTVNRVLCEWKDPRSVKQLLQDCGAARTGHAAEDPQVHLLLRGRHLQKSLPGTRCLYLDNRLTLHPGSLRVTGWRVENRHPMACHFMHTQEDAISVVLRSHVERSVSLEDLRGRVPIPTKLQRPGLDGWLERTDAGFRCRGWDPGMWMIAESSNADKFHFQFGTVNFTVSLQTVQYYRFDGRSKEFLRTDVTRDSKIEFSFGPDRSELIEVASQLVLALLLNANDRTLIPTETSPHYFVGRDGRRTLAVDVQAVLRLNFEDGSLRTLLGLRRSAGEQECVRKARRLLRFLESSRGQSWVTFKALDVDALIDKLRSAARRAGVDVYRFEIQI